MLRQYVRGSGRQVRKVVIEEEEGKKRIVRTSVGGHKIGLLLAALNKDGQIVIGHSKWNKKADMYDAILAEQVATDRLNCESETAPALSLYKSYGKFIGRAKRYFKAELCKSTTAAVENLRIALKVQITRQLQEQNKQGAVSA